MAPRPLEEVLKGLSEEEMKMVSDHYRKLMRQRHLDACDPNAEMPVYELRDLVDRITDDSVHREFPDDEKK